MARLILKSPYIKSTGGASGYLRYIATRERVELIPDDRPPTRKQEQLIAKLVKDFPDSKTLYEYEDYLTKPTKVNASAFITLALEANWDKQHFGLIEIPAETLLAKSYPVEFRPGDLLAVLVAFGLVAYVISNITVRSMVKHNA